jgi:glyoxylase-like metal-dependent hydrolase (beta-lactamase superfamily II)
LWRLGSAEAASASLAVVDLKDGLSVVTGAGGNVVVLARPEGLLLVDSGAAERATDLLTLLGQKFPAAPIGALFNTHWHLDHTGGNDAIAARGTKTIIAHENTRLWMSTKFYVEWEDRYYQRRAPACRPNKTFFTSDKQPLELAFGGQRVVYGQLTEAHTDGDLYVHFPEHNVIVAGGAVTAAKYPVLDYITGGWIGGMIDATQKLIALSDASTLIIPDVGPPQKRADLEEQVKMLSTVRERIEAVALQGRGVQDMIADAITKEFDQRYGGDSAQFISNAYESMWWSRLRGIVA